MRGSSTRSGPADGPSSARRSRRESEAEIIRRIATVAVYVDDQEAALAFWRDRAGFEVRREEAMGTAGTWLEVAPPGAESRVVIYPRSLMTNWRELKPSIVFECDDLAATHAAMSDRGVEFTEPPKKMAWGTYATFVDLDGNEFPLKGP